MQDDRRIVPTMSGWSGRRRAAVAAGVWTAFVVLGLIATLQSLAHDDFDGLNNMLQIPFAMPWFLLPVAGLWSHEVDAWVVAGYGLLNAAIIFVVMSKRATSPGSTDA
jgi:hypothetical protein